MASLANIVGIVTGGGTGIGRATALAMAKAGASLVIGNRNAKLGEEVVWAIEQAGDRAVFQVTDVSKPEDAMALVARAVKEFGRLDLAFNNAGRTASSRQPGARVTIGTADSATPDFRGSRGRRGARQSEAKVPV